MTGWKARRKALLLHPFSEIISQIVTFCNPNGRMTLFYADRKNPFGIDIDAFVRRLVKDVDVEGAAGRAALERAFKKRRWGRCKAKAEGKKRFVTDPILRVH